MYHLHSNRPTHVDTFEEYGDTHMATPPAKADPWVPFSSHADFEFAEIVLTAGLTSKQVDSMISIIGRVSKGSDPFTFKNHKDLRKTWEAASNLVTLVSLSV